MAAATRSAWLLIAFLTGCVSAPDRTDQVQEPVVAVSATTPATEPAPAPPPPPPPDNRRITVAAVGDIMLGTDFPENRLADDDGAGYLNEVAPLLRAADIAFGNLEGVLLDGGEPAKKCSNPSACYLFRSPTRYAAHLRNAGFDVISLANNHARDFGEEGRDASMQALSLQGIVHSGREGTVASWQHDGLRFAMLAFSPTKGSWPLLSVGIAEAAVAEVALTHDIVIVSFHGGAEGKPGAERLGFGMEYAYGEPRGNVVDFAHRVIDAGADLVLGHGPHVPRALELYRDRLIAYSLGNFATYYGISVSGAKGYAPVLLTEIDAQGRFRGGRLHSYIQQRPNGPRPDSRLRALNMMRELTALDFPDGELTIADDGTLGRRTPAP
ncbi:MAG: CapA family protein [Gammaproteobacteria bacterium]|nr:CapA family protein [Gammaproteobacteria bacterium]